MSKLVATMELRQLAYFVRVLQGQGLNATADSLGVAHSTLSAAVQKLETVTGLTLFRRQQGRSYPTDNALWLYRQAVLLLHMEEFVRLQRPHGDRIQWIRVELPIRFMAGRLSRVVSLAIRATAAEHPNALIWPQFLSGYSPALYDSQTNDVLRERSQWQPEGVPAGVVRLIHSERTDGTGPGVHLYDDQWIAVTRIVAETVAEEPRALTAEALSRKVVAVPNLPRPLLRQIAHYCRTQHIQVSQWSGGLLDVLGERTSIGEICVLMPRTLAASRIADLPVVLHELAEPLTLSLRGRVVRSHPAAEGFLAHLKASIDASVPTVEFEPRVSLRQLRYFDGLRTSVSLSDAARRLCVVQPALTVQLKGLEQAVGAKLVERQGRSANRIILTDAGHQLATVSRWVTAIVDDMERHLAAWSGRDSRNLRIGVPLAVTGLPALATALARATDELHHRFPGVAVEIIEARHQELVTMLQQRSIQLAILELRAGQLRYTPILPAERLVLVCSKDLDLLPGGPVQLSQLRHLRLVLPRSGSAVRMLVDEAAAASGFRMAPVVECDSPALALHHVMLHGLATVMAATEAEVLGLNSDFEWHVIDSPRLERRLGLAGVRPEPQKEPDRTFVNALRSAIGRTAHG